MKKILAAILAVLLLATACGPLPPSATPIANTKVIFSDDFSKPTSGWDRFQDYAGVTDYANVGYLIYIKSANMIKWTNPTPAKAFPNDVHIAIRTRIISIISISAVMGLPGSARNRKDNTPSFLPRTGN